MQPSTIQITAVNASLPTRNAKPPVAATPKSALVDALTAMGAAICYARNEEVYGEGEPAEFVYLVASGAVRTYKTLSDGRRQIAAFRLPGDVFGVEVGEDHAFTAEAIADCRIVVVKQTALMALAGRDGAVAREMWAETARDLARAQNLLLVLGRKSAEERVATFLLDMAGRGVSATTIELPMSRQDIADHLGLTIETVSRTISHLEQLGAIKLPASRRIELVNRAHLSRLNS